MTSLRTLLLSMAFFVAAPPLYAGVTASDAWVRATVPGQRVAAAYMRLRASEPSALVGVRTPSARQAQTHEMSMQAGVMRMRHVSRLPLPANRTVELKPGGYHIMLIDLPAPLNPGDVVTLTLDIELHDRRKEELRIDAPVRSAAESGAGQDHKH